MNNTKSNTCWYKQQKTKFFQHALEVNSTKTKNNIWIILKTKKQQHSLLACTVLNGSGVLHACKVLEHYHSVSFHFCSRPQVGLFTSPKSKLKVQNSKFKIQSSKFKIQSSKSKGQNPKFKVQRSKFKIQSSKSKGQNPKFKVQRSKFNHGQSSHDKITSTNPPCASPMDPLCHRTCQQSEHIPIVSKKFNSFVIKIIMQPAA